MSPIILDASITCIWAMPDEQSEAATAALRRLVESGAWVPWIWWFEIRNALLINQRRKRIGRADVKEFLLTIRSFRITCDSSPDDAAILAFAESHGLSFYDAAYLELAARLSIPLATMDRRLATAAGRAGVSLFGEG